MILPSTVSRWTKTKPTYEQILTSWCLQLLSHFTICLLVWDGVGTSRAKRPPAQGISIPSAFGTYFVHPDTSIISASSNRKQRYH